MAEADEFRWQECFAIFKDILGHRLAAKYWKEMYLCILAVDCGLKTSYLVDQCCIQPLQVHKLVTNLHCEKLISSDNLCTVLIFDDIFVLQSKKTLIHLHRILNKCHVGFVDVSQDLDEPKLHKCENFLGLLKRFCVKFTDFIERCNKVRQEDSSLAEIFEFKDKIIHPCTVFGIILGYPLVYWLSDVSETNCLSAVVLTVYSCEIAVKSWRDKSEDFMTVSSFSFPETLTAVFKKHIKSWQEDMAVVSKKQKMLVHRIVCKQVRLPVVIL